MVKHALIPFAAVGLLAVSASASPPIEDDYYDIDDDVSIAEEDESPAFNMFGFTMQIGALPLDGENTVAMSLGLGIEHPVFKKTRVSLDYDWLWLLQRDDSARAQMSTLPRPEPHASGHRASLGLRRELTAKSGRTLRLFVDGELGGSVALINDSFDGMRLMPGGYAGLRAGWDIYSKRDDSPSRTFEGAFLLRAVGVRDGVGVTFGVGLFWGN